MKTAISIPDEIFTQAERYAKRSKISRSKLYGQALSEYLARHSRDEVTEAMNQALEQINQASDDFSALAARRSLERAEW